MLVNNASICGGGVRPPAAMALIALSQCWLRKPTGLVSTLWHDFDYSITIEVWWNHAMELLERFRLQVRQSKQFLLNSIVAKLLSRQRHSVIKQRVVSKESAGMRKLHSLRRVMEGGGLRGKQSGTNYCLPCTKERETRSGTIFNYLESNNF